MTPNRPWLSGHLPDVRPHRSRAASATADRRGPAPGVNAGAPAAQGDGGPNTYFSVPPDPLAAKVKVKQTDRRPKPPPTKGTVTGQVTGPNGTPIPHALVTGIRFSDLGLPVDLTEEKRVLARTNGAGRFTLKQLREPYLIRVCSESVSSGGGGHRAQRPGRKSGECDQESTKRFTPSYVGPDGNFNSWMRHTRFFRPQAHRSLGRVVVQPPAVVTGTWKVDGANRVLNLTRIDGSVAATTLTDGKGNYRFEVAPGPYRLEADRDEGLHTDSTVPGYLSKRLLLRAGRTVHDSFKTKHAGIIRGLVSSNGTPLPDQFLAILDKDGNFAAGVVTNEIGRYVVSSLKPGPYTVTTSYAASAFVPKSQIVAVATKTVATADLALDPGRSVSFSVSDVVYPGGQRLGRRRAPQRRRPGAEGLPGQPAPPARWRRHLQWSADEHLLAVRASERAPDQRARADRLPVGGSRGQPGGQRQPPAPSGPARPADDEPHGHPPEGWPAQADRGPRGQLAAPGAHRRRPGHADGAQLDRAVRGRRLHRARHRPGHLRRRGHHGPQGAWRQADHHRREPRGHPLDGDRQTARPRRRPSRRPRAPRSAGSCVTTAATGR